MTTRGRRGQPRDARQPVGESAEGAERYMWAFVEGSHVVLSIPGIRDLELSADDAQLIGEMLIAQSKEVRSRQSRDRDREDGSAPTKEVDR